MKNKLILIIALVLYFNASKNTNAETSPYSQQTHFYFNDILTHDEQKTYNQQKQIIQQIEDHKIQFVDFWFTDLLGQLREVIIPAHHVAHALTSGLSFDGSSIPGNSTVDKSDMLLQADTATFTIIPSVSEHTKSARIICDVYRSKNVPYEGDPRYRLKQAEKKAYDLGFEFLVGPELEFFLLNSDNTPIDSDGYFSAELNLQKKENKKALMWILKAQGVNIEKLHHEVPQGQHEMSIRYAPAWHCADQVIIAKHTISTIAQNLGWNATFMPKPFLNENGSAMHIHFSLRNREDKTNAFYDKNDPTRLSPLAKHFIAGVLKHIQEISALLNPTENSYERLVPGYEAPVYVCWATKNRSALIRIPESDETDSCAVRAELRSPDATTNPYLAFTAILEAGLAGIENNEELPPAIEENLYTLTQAQIKERNIPFLPISLEQALNWFAESSFVHEKLGERIVSEFIKIKHTEYSHSDKSLNSTID